MPSYARADLEALASLLTEGSKQLWELQRWQDSGRLRRASESLLAVLTSRPRVKAFPLQQLRLLLPPTTPLYRSLLLPPEELPLLAAAAEATVAGIVARVRLARGF